MKSTGIIRRIDDLGRIVVPKEIRHRLDISEGDPLELFVLDDEYVAFRKYAPEPTVRQSLDRFIAVVSEEPELRQQPEILEKLSEISTLLKEG